MLGLGDDIGAIPGLGLSRPPTNFLRRTVYTVAGTVVWNKGYGTTAINVIVQGGGAAGSTTFGGGQGGLSIAFIDATNFTSQSITIGLGATSSFGSLISATAGSTLLGGVGVGGDINFTGQGGGQTSIATVAMPGGGIGGGFGTTGATGGAGTLGGGGGQAATTPGAASVGYVIVEEYA